MKAHQIKKKQNIFFGCTFNGNVIYNPKSDSINCDGMLKLKIKQKTMLCK